MTVEAGSRGDPVNVLPAPNAFTTWLATVACITCGKNFLFSSFAQI